MLTIARRGRRTRAVGSRGTTRQASAAPLRLGSIWAREVRYRVAGTGPSTPYRTRPSAPAPSFEPPVLHSRAMTGPEPLPDVFRERFAGLEEQRYTSSAGDVFHRCFGCGPAHPIGLRVRCFKIDGGVLSPILVNRRFEGPPGTAHGGIVAAYLDEILAGAVVRATGRLALTGELTVRYVRPVPLETPLLGRAQLVTDHGRYVDVEGRIEHPDTSDVLATGRGRFFFAAGSERPVW